MAFLTWFFDLWDNRTLGAARSSGWRQLRQDFIKANPDCAFGHKGNLLNPIQVHHVLPFNQHPELELEWENLVSLCRAHHLYHGHLGSYRSWNETIKSEATLHRLKVKTRP